MNIKQQIFNYNLRHAPKRKTAFPKINKPNTILLLYQSDIPEKNLQIKQLIKELRNNGNTVVSWGYVEKKQAATPIMLGSRILAKNDLTILGAPKKHLKREILQQHFDILIDLTLSPVLPLQYIALWAQANCKTGKQPATEPYIYDFMIQLDKCEDAAQLFDQIMFYLKQIRSND